MKIILTFIINCLCKSNNYTDNEKSQGLTFDLLMFPKKSLKILIYFVPVNYDAQGNCVNQLVVFLLVSTASAPAPVRHIFPLTEFATGCPVGEWKNAQ